ncbi:MAG TPA: DUF4389 domain-containing protein [Candidatus Paceibacterota bacterium]|nr:DUF4389 domain-containing protein [Candidatus Paceibacterota bacterium]
MDNTNIKDYPRQIKENSYPVRFEVDYPEKSSRILALIAIPWFFLKSIILIPHIIVLWFFGIAQFIAVWLSFWAILFTGRYPKSFFNFVVGVLRWQNRMNAWLYSLTDKYPPFSLN